VAEGLELVDEVVGAAPLVDARGVEARSDLLPPGTV